MQLATGRQTDELIECQALLIDLPLQHQQLRPGLVPGGLGRGQIDIGHLALIQRLVNQGKVLHQTPLDLLAQ